MSEGAPTPVVPAAIKEPEVPLAPQPGATPAVEPTASPKLKGSELKYTTEDGVPDWAVGKTADEMLTMTQTLYNTVVSNPVPAPAATPTPVSTAPASSGPPDANLMYTNADEYNRQLGEWTRNTAQSTMQAASAPFVQGQMELAKAESKRNLLYTEVWSRYGPEIEAEVAQFPVHGKISVSFWNDAAAMIKGRRAEDLFKARLAADAPADAGTFGSGGSPGAGLQASSFASPLAKAWSEDAPWVLQFKRLPGMSVEKLRNRVRDMGWTEESYAEHFEKKTAMRIYGSAEELAAHGVN